MDTAEFVAWSYLIGGVIVALNSLQLIWAEYWAKSREIKAPRGIAIGVLVFAFTVTVGIWPIVLFSSTKRAVQAKWGKKEEETDG